MYEPSILPASLQYSCDACGELPILGVRWVCERCEDYDLCDSCHSRQLHKRSRARANEDESEGESDWSGDSEASASAGTHDATHEMRSFVVEDTLMPMTRGSLKEVVLNATSRWYVETLRLAKSGDANAAALTAQMLRAGYGCHADSEEATYWQRVARSAGARRIEGVYDELP
jgi:TPR repeat protein|tara:strand:+ start:219 stop:737 length:519 start_codon:yes stop_codon:yes gene_type:complete